MYITLSCDRHHHPPLFSSQTEALARRMVTPHPPVTPAVPRTPVLLSVRILDTSKQWTYAVFVLCVWLINPSVMLSRFTHVVACIETSFFFIVSNSLSYKYATSRRMCIPHFV